MGRPHSDVSVQPIDNKALSWGITRKSACILTEIKIRKSQEVKFCELFPDRCRIRTTWVRLERKFLFSPNSFDISSMVTLREYGISLRSIVFFVNLFFSKSPIALNSVCSLFRF